MNAIPLSKVTRLVWINFEVFNSAILASRLMKAYISPVLSNNLISSDLYLLSSINCTVINWVAWFELDELDCCGAGEDNLDLDSTIIALISSLKLFIIAYRTFIVTGDSAAATWFKWSNWSAIDADIAGFFCDLRSYLRGIC